MSALKVVIRVFDPSLGGGRSIPTAWRSVTSKVSRSAVGNSVGRTRSVMVAIPTRMSGSLLRSRTANVLARWKRVGAPGPEEASIDRDVSMTKNAAASLLTSRADLLTSVGCAAAAPSSAAIATSDVTTAPRETARVPGRPRTPTTRRRLRSASTNATSGATTASATSAPSGLTKVISSRGRAGLERRFHPAGRDAPCPSAVGPRRS